MNQSERRQYLIRALLAEQPRYNGMEIPPDAMGQKLLLRSLFNVREPGEADGSFLAVQDEYLREEIRQKGVTRLSDLSPIEPGIFLWRGDITTLAADAIVNAANSGMTGCYQPCHTCIDNCIHTFAGIQLRNFCAKIMAEQGHPEPTGTAKITPGYNLPCRYVIHTVGPIVRGRLTGTQENQLASCYRACLSVARGNGCESIAFCCISTGVFGFPKERAAEIAVQTVRDFLKQTSNGMKVIFNVFGEEDEQIYRRLLGKNGTAA